MSEKEQIYGDDKIKQQRKPAAKAALSPQHFPPIQKTKLDSLQPDAVKYLQRKFGNKATTEWLLAKQGRLPAHNPGGLVQLKTSQPDTSDTLENDPEGSIKRGLSTLVLTLQEQLRRWSGWSSIERNLALTSASIITNITTAPWMQQDPKKDAIYLYNVILSNDSTILNQFIEGKVFLYALTPIKDSNVSDALIEKEGKDPKGNEAYIQTKVPFRKGDTKFDDAQTVIYPKTDNISISDGPNIRIVSPSIRPWSFVWKAIKDEVKKNTSPSGDL